MQRVPSGEGYEFQKAGADDYLTKPFAFEELLSASQGPVFAAERAEPIGTCCGLETSKLIAPGSR